MVKIHEQRTIAAPPEQVFNWLLDPANLTVSPWFRKAVWLRGTGPGVGATRELKGFGFWVHEQLTTTNRPIPAVIALWQDFRPRIKTGGSLALRPVT